MKTFKTPTRDSEIVAEQILKEVTQPTRGTVQFIDKPARDGGDFKVVRPGSPDWYVEVTEVNTTQDGQWSNTKPFTKKIKGLRGAYIFFPNKDVGDPLTPQAASKKLGEILIQLEGAFAHQPISDQDLRKLVDTARSNELLKKEDAQFIVDHIIDIRQDPSSSKGSLSLKARSLSGPVTGGRIGRTLDGTDDFGKMVEKTIRDAVEKKSSKNVFANISTKGNPEKHIMLVGTRPEMIQYVGQIADPDDQATGSTRTGFGPDLKSYLDRLIQTNKLDVIWLVAQSGWVVRYDKTGLKVARKGTPFK